MDREITKQQIGSIVSLLVAGKVPHDDVQVFIDKYKDEPSEKKRKQSLPMEDDHYRLHVSYAKLPDAEELEKLFSGKDSVSPLFCRREWVNSMKIDETPGERDFLLAKLPPQFVGRYLSEYEDGLSEYYDALGYRFACLTEAFEFAQTHPQIQRLNQIIALGSSTHDKRGRCAVALQARGYNHERALRVIRFHAFVSKKARLLLVRK